MLQLQDQLRSSVNAHLCVDLLVVRFINRTFNLQTVCLQIPHTVPYNNIVNLLVSCSPILLFQLPTAEFHLCQSVSISFESGANALLPEEPRGSLEAMKRGEAFLL